MPYLLGKIKKGSKTSCTEMPIYYDVNGKGEHVLHFHTIIKYGHKGTFILPIKRQIT